MRNVLVTGMSGTGKSSVLAVLQTRGMRVVDTDTDEWCRWVDDEDGRPDWIWREERMSALLRGSRGGPGESSPPLFVSGCKTNQGQFYDRFDHVVLLSAPAAVLRTRLMLRDNNDYGKDPAQWQDVLHYLDTVEPLLRAGATAEIDATRPLSEIADELLALVAGP